MFYAATCDDHASDCLVGVWDKIECCCLAAECWVADSLLCIIHHGIRAVTETDSN